MTNDTAGTLVRRYVTEVLHEENYEAIDELYETSFAEPKPTITGGVASSVEDLKASYAAFHERVSIEDIDILTTHAGNSEAVAIWMGKTIYIDSFGGIRPAGNPQPHQEMTWIEIEDGKITRAHHLRDSLETIPPAARAAHTSALTMVETGVMAVDTADTIVFANPAVQDLLNRSRDAVLGRSIDELLADSVARLDPGESIEFDVENGQRVFEVSASALRDERYGMTVGRFFLFYEITERKQRVQRLQVLTRVLRHNLRNNLDAILGSAEVVTERVGTLPGDVSAAIDRLIESGRELATLSSKASTIDTQLEPETEQYISIDVTDRLRELANKARAEYPDRTVDYTSDDDLVIQATPSLPDGLWELVENACEYNDAPEPRVSLQAVETEAGVEVRIVDNGPGIPRYERDVIQRGEETALEHGSGLGLWIAKWSINASGGSIRFDDRDPRGTDVVVELPVE